MNDKQPLKLALTFPGNSSCPVAVSLDDLHRYKRLQGKAEQNFNSNFSSMSINKAYKVQVKKKRCCGQPTI